MGKRAAGEGSVFKRGNRWVAQVGSGDDRETAYFSSQHEANQWRHDKNELKKNGLLAAGSKVMLSVYLNEWLIVAESSVRPNTYNQYVQIVNQHIIPALGKIKLKDLRPDQLQALYISKLKNGTSARTTVMIHAVIHRALHNALQLGLVGRNVAEAVSRPRIPRKEIKTLNDSQVRKLILTLEGNRYQMLFWLAVTTGLRQGELFGLKWSDLEWETRIIHIQRQVQRQTEGLVFTEPKSAAGRRVITLGKGTIQKLHTYYDQQQKERVFAGDKWQDKDLIFSTPIGTPLEASNILKIFKKCLKEADLPNLRFHDLRHTAATLMLQEGINPKIVQERLGHSDISLTLNTYSHVLPSMQEDAAEKLDELLTPIDVSQELHVITKVI